MIMVMRGRLSPWMLLMGLAMTWLAKGTPAVALDYDRFLAEKSPSLVTLTFVAKVKMGGAMAHFGDQAMETEAAGVMIDPKGLVLCSNTQLGGISGAMRRMMPGGGDITVTPTNIKVLIGPATEGIEATLLARDSELDLAWVQIKNPSGRRFDCVDLTKSTATKLGEPIVVVRRMGKFFGRQMIISESRVGGITTKPRLLYIPSAQVGMGMGLGLPVYADSGTIVGITVMQTPNEEEGGDPMGMFGSSSSLEDMMAGVILPASEVVEATQRVMAAADKKKEAPSQ